MPSTSYEGAVPGGWDENETPTNANLSIQGRLRDAHQSTDELRYALERYGVIIDSVSTERKIDQAWLRRHQIPQGAAWDCVYAMINMVAALKADLETAIEHESDREVALEACRSHIDRMTAEIKTLREINGGTVRKPG